MRDSRRSKLDASSRSKTELTKKQNKYLSRIYFNPSNSLSFSGLEKLWKGIKSENIVSKRQLKLWLRSQDIYTNFHPFTRRFKRPKTVSPKMDYYWQADSAYMTSYWKHNSGYAFFTVFIDIFTRFVWAAPLKTLRSIEMRSVMQNLFASNQTEVHNTEAAAAAAAAAAVAPATVTKASTRTVLFKTYKTKQSIQAILMKPSSQINLSQTVEVSLSVVLCKHISKKTMYSTTLRVPTPKLL